jgi:hypothetical protein
MKKINVFCFILTLGFTFGCNRIDLNNLPETGSYPEIFPDYKSVTIPPDIAPLDFKITGKCNMSVVVMSGNAYNFKIRSSSGNVVIPGKKWKKLLKENEGREIKLKVVVDSGGTWRRYRSFNIYVAPDPVDDYLVYRLLIPGFQNWNRMGIYQRSLTSYREKTVIDSRVLPGTCMNCHSFAQNDPGNMVLHLRESYGGTLLYAGGKLEKLKTKTGKMFASAAFPYWHPSKKYVVFSVNKVNQIFHAAGPFHATALDMKSDIVLFDVKSHEMKIPPQLSKEDKYETFPCFSPDGKTLYFCSADEKKLPAEFRNMKYSLCSVSFEENKGEFGEKIDTLISSAKTGKSISIPRVSPDGKSLMFNMCDYGAFPGYNPEADLWILDLRNNEYHALDSINSNNVESYHSWSSNGRWVAFSSRRTDGLYSDVFISYVDRNGNFHKPFLLPQKDPDFYTTFLYSFNVPEFTVKEINVDPYMIEKVAKSTSTIQVQQESSH